jgi:four helix bundle protein
MRDFRRLKVWQRSHKLSLRVDALIRRFPRRGYARLKDQLSGAADSIPSNIVEGSAAATELEFARFLDISIKSTSETEYHVLSAYDKGLIPRTEHDYLIDEISQIRRMLYWLRQKILRDLRNKGEDV